MKKLFFNFIHLRKAVLPTGIFLLCFTINGWSQIAPLPVDHPIAVAAPHLPPILRHDGIGKPMYGDKFTYKQDENIANLKKWLIDYPEEVVKYKEAISGFLKSSDLSTLSENEKELYYDLKFQRMMISQI